MNSKRYILLTAGAVLAASLIANATTSEKPATSNEATSTESNDTTPAKPAVCNDTKRSETKPAKPAICDENKPAESTVSSDTTPLESTVSNDTTPVEPTISSDATPGALGSSAPQASGATTPASRTVTQGSPLTAAPRSTSDSHSTVSPKVFSPKTPVPASSDNPPVQPDTPDTVLTPEGLATADTILSYCAQINTNGAQTYQEFLLAITRDHSNAEISGVRMDPDYAKTQAVLNSQLAKVPYGSGITACRSLGTNGHGLPGLSTPIHTKLTESD